MLGSSFMLHGRLGPSQPAGGAARLPLRHPRAAARPLHQSLGRAHAQRPNWRRAAQHLPRLYCANGEATPATAATRRGGLLPTSPSCCRGAAKEPTGSIDPTSARPQLLTFRGRVIGHERAFAALFDHLLGERRDGTPGRRLLAYGRLNQIYLIASAQRQFKMKNRASGNTSRHPDPTIVAVDDRFTDR